jgi:hypothetical protein
MIYDVFSTVIGTLISVGIISYVRTVTRDCLDKSKEQKKVIGWHIEAQTNPKKVKLEKMLYNIKKKIAKMVH